MFSISTMHRRQPPYGASQVVAKSRDLDAVSLQTSSTFVLSCPDGSPVYRHVSLSSIFPLLYR